MPEEQISITKNSEVRLASVLLAALVLLFVVSVAAGGASRKQAESIPKESARTPFPQVAIEAKAAYVYDVRSGEVLYAKNEDIRLPLASLTKVMSALTAADLSPEYGTVVIGADALAAEGDSGFYRDEKWSLRDLINFSMVSSSNDGMRAVALALGALERATASPEEMVEDFVNKMNIKASELGLKNTYFVNETGLDESEVMGGAYGSARDVAILMKHVLAERPEIFEATNETAAAFLSLDSNVHVAKNTNVIAGEIPGLIASKTGYTSAAGGNLAIIFDPELGRPIVVSVLGSSAVGRFEDMRKLVRASMEYIQNN